MKFQHNDGGRAAAGFKGTTGDCVTRSIAIITGVPYMDVYNSINELASKERTGKRKRKKSNARTGVYRQTSEKYLKQLGYKWVATMHIGEGCKVHMKQDELPPGRLIVRVTKHMTAVIDGVIHDTHDCSRDETRCVYGYYFKPDDNKITTSAERDGHEIEELMTTPVILPLENNSVVQEPESQPTEVITTTAEVTDETRVQDPAQPTFDVNAFTGLEWMLKYVTPETEANPMGLLITFLTAFGNLVGRNCYHQVSATKHYPVLFAVLVGASSKARKGTSMDIVKEIFIRIDKGWVKSNIKSGMSTGEGIKYHVRDEVKKINSKGEEIIKDEGVADKRILLQESEFAQPLRVSRRPGNTLSTTIRDFWDNGNPGTLTKKDPVSVTNAHISILAHITVSEIVKNLSETDAANGYANRFLWLFVSRNGLKPDGGHIPYDKLPYDKISKAVKFASEPRQIRKSTEANIEWAKIYTDLSVERMGILGSITCRAEAQVLRLSLIYALLACSPTIEVAHLKAAMAVWKYCEDSAKYIFGEKFGNPISDAIMSHLRSSNGAGLTKTDIHKLFGNNRKTGAIDAALSELVRYNLIRTRKNKTAGRPEIIYELHEVN